MRRFGPRDITLYFLLALLLCVAVVTLQDVNRGETPTYSQIRTYFLQEQVEFFTLEDNTLTLTLRPKDQVLDTALELVEDLMLAAG